ncbi:hypothetical protein DL768_007513 [Monosporascus sp. mg162]|nr:hypothetical protein DL768_007513 [Monosporascus sp. mg162]
MAESQEQSKSALKKAEKQAKMAAAKAEKAAKTATLPVVGGAAKKGGDPREIIGITVSKETDFPQWYQELVIKAELVEYYSEISGFYILRPAAMHIWNEIRAWFQERIQDMGVDETSFPMFLSSKSLEKEKEHVEGFAPELAWVTKAAHLTEKLAEEEVLQILELYAGVYERSLLCAAKPYRKTENEKFAGGYWTSTCEAYIPTNGRGIQGATSHALGQNFSKMFDITVEDPEKKGDKIHVWQNSWGLSTRVIGVMVMLHGDDKGLVLPPRVSKIQAIIIPVGITAKMSPEDKDAHMKRVDEIRASLKSAKVRVDVDSREGYTPGFKFADWEMKGVPLRLEFGPKDAANSVVSYARRDTGAKGTIPIDELATQVPALLQTIQQDLYNKADEAYKSHRLRLTEWEKVVPALDSRNVVLIPFCEEAPCEERIKEMTKSENGGEVGPDGRQLPSMGMKSLCIPFEQPEGLVRGETKCLNPECGKLAKSWTMFGRSY